MRNPDSDTWQVEDGAALALPQALARVRPTAAESRPRLSDDPEVIPLFVPPRFWRWAMTGSFLVATYVGGAIGDVVGESGLVWSAGPALVLVLIAFDSVSSLGAMGAVARTIDRLERSKLALRVAVTCAAANAMVALVLAGGRAGPAVFGGLVLLERFQFIALYATALAFGRDVFGTQVRAQTWLRALGTMGAFGGALGAGGAAALGVKSWTLFVVSSCCLAFSALVIFVGRRIPKVRWAPTSLVPAAASSSALVPVVATPAPPPDASALFLAFSRIRGYLAESHRVRLIAAIGLLNGMAYVTIAYEAACLFDHASNGGDVQVRYGVLRAAEPIAAIVTNVLLARWLVTKMGRFRMFLTGPLIFFAGTTALLCVPRVSVVIVAASAVQVAFGIESTALSATLTSLPAGKRERVGALLESGTYQVGYLTACAAFLALVAFGHAGAMMRGDLNRAWLLFGWGASALGVALGVALARGGGRATRGGTAP